MNPNPRLLLLACLAASCAAHAAETTIAKRPFTIRHSLQATVLPAETVAIRLDARSWSDFALLEVAPHAASVKKDQPLLVFDAETIDQKLHDLRQSLETNTLALAQAELDLKELVDTTPHRLEAARRAAEEAREANEYFVKTRRAISEESADQTLERFKQSLANQTEELRQLEKMYAADDLTEETEEIILQRQRDRVVAAEFELKAATLNHKRTRELGIPREAVTLAENQRDTARALAKLEKDAPRAIRRKEIEVAGLKVALAREKESLAKIEADRSLFEIKAPADGWFYHGAIEDGRWTTGEAVKALIPHGRPLTRRTLATFIPAGAAMHLHARVNAATALQLDAASLKGNAWFEGREDQQAAIRLESIEALPATDGTFGAVFSATWPEDMNPRPGVPASLRILSYHAPEAMVVPAKALELGPDGWTVEVKLADGKTERRPVQRGRSSQEETQILEGLEAGQVVVSP
jgi:HlyD family secretion protein